SEQFSLLSSSEPDVAAFFDPDLPVHVREGEPGSQTRIFQAPRVTATPELRGEPAADLRTQARRTPLAVRLEGPPHPIAAPRSAGLDAAMGVHHPGRLEPEGRPRSEERRVGKEWRPRGGAER